MSTATIDAVGNIHDAKGQFAGHVLGEADAGMLAGQAVPLGFYSDIKDRDERSARMSADLEAAVNDLVEGGQLQAWLDSQVHSRQGHWSFGNQVLAAMQYQGIRAEQDDQTRAEFPQPMMMSKTAWARLGRQLRPGTRAIWIQRPITRKGVRKNRVTGEEEEYFYVAGCSPQAEYDISQTEGDPVPGYGVLSPKVPQGSANPAAIAGLAARITECGYEVVEEEIPGLDPAAGTGSYGYSDPKTKRVVIDPRVSDASRLNTYAHELAHIRLGHTDDLDEYRKHRGRMETEAEATAYLVGRHLGCDGEEVDAFSAAYIAGWSQRAEPGTVTRSLAAAMKACNQILDGDW